MPAFVWKDEYYSDPGGPIQFGTVHFQVNATTYEDSTGTVQDYVEGDGSVLLQGMTNDALQPVDERETATFEYPV